MTGSQFAARQTGLQGAKPLAIPAELLAGARISMRADDSRQPA
jgi:hypothetical protein